VEDVGAGEVLVAEAEAFDSGAFVAGVESAVVESLVCGRLDDQVEGRGGDVVVRLLGGGQGHRGCDGCEESGLHVCGFGLVLVVLSGLVWRDVGKSRSGKWKTVGLMLHSKQVQMQACRSGFIYSHATLDHGRTGIGAGRHSARRHRTPVVTMECGIPFKLTCPPKPFATASAALVRIGAVLGWHLTSRKLPCGNIVEEVEELSRIDCSAHAWRSCQSATMSLSACEALVGGDYKRLLQVKADGRNTFL
jgi:hypothetical protein